MTNKRITLTSGDYIKLSDIPNEQVFNLVKRCFINAGFTDLGRYAQWDNRSCHTAVRLGGYSTQNLIQFTEGERQLSLSDIFNSVNGGVDWKGCNYLHLFDDGAIRFTIADKYSNNVIKRIPEEVQATIPPKTSQWWDYEKECAVGLPTIDTECEYSLSNGRTWYKCKIISHNKLVLDCPHIKDENDNGLQVVNKSAVMFRPLDYKTKKQIIVDKTFEAILRHITVGGDLKLVRETIELLHDMGLLKGDK